MSFHFFSKTLSFCFSDDILLRSRRQTDDDEGCDDGYVLTVDGLCADSAQLAADLADMYDDDEDETDGRLRKFPMGSSESAEFGSGLERTKRRSQRMTLLLAKVIAGGQLVDKDSGNKIKSKDFISRVNEYGCHCWPSQTKEQLTGYGKALDLIDQGCYDLKQCHQCIKIDYGASEEGLYFEIFLNYFVDYFKIVII